ncbi:FabG-like 3-oxoacyl-(acyl-carrier-protein) reductase [Paraconexibacter sp. AEG42_29]|uniref:FabG-like 3-oxoacyl-(Acyl-carrier-protein) reductase n=1 Tax=Paraconexibacter sp. AEG42_29 TaxID=2997339 RepID=A0AAU7APH7_9ACTN
MTVTRREVALVTGASSGIGVELARQLAAAGHDLALAARRTALMEQLADELRRNHSVRVDIFQSDLGRAGAGADLHRRIADAGLQVSYLVNNAGATLEGRYLDFTAEEQISIINLLAVNPAELMHLCLPGMLEAGRGTMLTISSLGAYWPCFPGITVYAGAKALVVNLTRTLDAEYGAHGVTFSATVPFTTDTAFLDTPTNRQIVGRMPNSMIQSPQRVASIAIDGAAHGRLVQHTSPLNRVLAGLLTVMPPKLVGRAILAFMSMGRDDLNQHKNIPS